MFLIYGRWSPSRPVHRLLIGLLLLCLTTASCAQSAEKSESPKLVVLVVLDQVGQWVLDLYLPLLSEDSFIRKAYETGAVHTVSYPYASTITAPGHATIATGTTPAVHGIVANNIYNPELGELAITDDRVHEVIGNQSEYVSPTMLRADTVADAVYKNSNGQAHIIGISIKARSAVLSGGRHANLAVFYDENAGGMTTSTYYAPNGELPQWLTAFNEAIPLEKRITVWTPEKPEWLQEHFGPNGQPGEGGPLGLGNRFPYDPYESSNPKEAFTYTPQSTEFLLEAALAAVEGENMGQGSTVDYLALSISGTDLIGHSWGPQSWEYADNLMRTDRALTNFTQQLEKRGPVTFFLTADHGVSPIPERLIPEGFSAGRIAAVDVVEQAEQAAGEVLGPGSWIAAYLPPLLSYKPMSAEQRDTLTSALIEALPSRIEGVEQMYDATQASTLRSRSDEIAQLVGASIPDDPPGNLYLLTHIFYSNAVYGRLPVGTNHGSPRPYDRNVPVLMWGAGIEQTTSNPEVLDARQIAPTLTKLLGVQAPAQATYPPLPGVVEISAQSTTSSIR